MSGKRLNIRDKDLVIHFLNVGLGDAIVIEFPKPKRGDRPWGIIDFYNADKAIEYLDKLNDIRPRSEIAFVCATHPHMDHISGIPRLLRDPAYRPVEFWDSGFRHNSSTYRKILKAISEHGIRMRRVSSGMEWYYGRVRVTALSPSVALRNRYATYGVDMNNASVVLRLENCRKDAVITQSARYVGKHDPERERTSGRAVAILGGDAEFDSWAQISQEYPFIERTSHHDPQVKKMVNMLNCWLVKVAHHGSMHSSPLEVYERMHPKVAVISARQDISKSSTGVRRGLYPHPTTEHSLAEVGAEVVTTDGYYEQQAKAKRGGRAPRRRPGTIVAVIPPGGTRRRYMKLSDREKSVPDPPARV